MNEPMAFMVGLMAIVMGGALLIVALGLVHPVPPLGFAIIFGVEALVMIAVGVLMIKDAFR